MSGGVAATFISNRWSERIDRRNNGEHARELSSTVTKITCARITRLAVVEPSALLQTKSKAPPDGICGRLFTDKTEIAAHTIVVAVAPSTAVCGLALVGRKEGAAAMCVGVVVRISICYAAPFGLLRIAAPSLRGNRAIAIAIVRLRSIWVLGDEGGGQPIVSRRRRKGRKREQYSVDAFAEEHSEGGHFARVFSELLFAVDRGASTSNSLSDAPARL